MVVLYPFQRMIQHRIWLWKIRMTWLAIGLVVALVIGFIIGTNLQHSEDKVQAEGIRKKNVELTDEIWRLMGLLPPAIAEKEAKRMEEKRGPTKGGIPK